MVKGVSRGAVGQGIILRQRPIGRESSSASHATGRGKVRRLVPGQAPGQWALVLLLALALPGLGSLLSCSCLSCLPCKRPRPVSSSPSPSSLLSSFPRQVKPPAPQQPNQPVIPVPVSYRVLSHVFQVLVALHVQIQIPNTVCALAFDCLNSQTQQKVPAFIPSAT